MKNIFLTALTLLMLPAVAYSQGWVSVDLPTDQTITGVAFPSADTGFAITAKGLLLRTRNGAQTWSSLTVAKDAFLEDIDFINGKTGLICARKGLIFRTEDGGNTWSSWSSNDTADYFGSVKMTNDRIGVVVGLHKTEENPALPAVYRTTDGGRTWKSLGMEGLGYAEVIAASRKLYMLSFGTLHQSTDLGATWTSVPTVEGDPGRCFAIFGKTGIIGGPRGMRAVSSDSGRTWEKLEAEGDGLFIAAELVNEKRGYVGGYPSLLYVTEDGGRTLSRELPARQFDVLDLCMVGDRIYAVGANGGMVYKKVR